jgi:hypothetical protein
MKNTLYIDIDSEREQPILIGKGPDSVGPQTKEEAANMVQIDIKCMAEALISLIHLADQNGYGDKEQLVNESIALLEQYKSLPKAEQINTNENDG